MQYTETIERLIKTIRNRFPDLSLLEQEPMVDHCSFRTGGKVRVFVCPRSEEELLRLYTACREAGVAPVLLGNGTNLVFPDEDCACVVLGTENLRQLCLGKTGEIVAAAGVALSRLAAFACENGLEGLEFASGIPGTVGGGLLMNAGAYGGELKDCVKSVRVYDASCGKIVTLENSGCGFGYRRSIFQKGQSIVLSALFSLQQGDKRAIREKMKDLNRRRREKQPLDLPSAGSTFRRPEGYYAAALIEECGLKGIKIGGAQVSEKHAGFIVNTGNATTADLAQLIRLVQDEVYEKKHIVLQPEVILVPPPEYKEPES